MHTFMLATGLMSCGCKDVGSPLCLSTLSAVPAPEVTLLKWSKLFASSPTPAAQRMAQRLHRSRANACMFLQFIQPKSQRFNKGRQVELPTSRLKTGQNDSTSSAPPAKENLLYLNSCRGRNG